MSDDDSTVVHELNWSEKQNDTTFKIDRIGIVKDEMESGAEGAIAVHFVIDNGSKKISQLSRTKVPFLPILKNR